MDALEWLSHLYPKLQERAVHMKKMDAYYRGDHPLPFLSPSHADKMRSTFREMLTDSRSNFMRLIVEVTEERLEVEGLRLSADSDLGSDQDSWKVWQANQMDSLSRAAFTEALVKGVCYISVWPAQGDEEYPMICVEDATEVIVSYRPGSNFRVRDAAIKVWVDEMEPIERANVYLPNGIYKFQRPSPMPAQRMTSSGIVDDGWIPLESDGSDEDYDDDEGPHFVANTLGVVPLIPLRNRGRLLVEGESELSDITSVQNQINGFLFLLALAGYFGAHKQRWATGITLFEDEDTGQVLEPWDIAVDKMLIEESADAKFGEFEQTDLTGYLKAIDQKVSHLAIVSRTPKHYLLPEGQDPSGDAIKSSESGLVRKIQKKATSFGEALEEVMQLARKSQGKEVTVDSEIVWADPSTESEAVRTDATVKQFEAGLIPAEVALEDLGYSQTQIARIMTARAAEILVKGMEVPPSPDGQSDSVKTGIKSNETPAA